MALSFKINGMVR